MPVATLPIGLALSAVELSREVMCHRTDGIQRRYDQPAEPRDALAVAVVAATA